MANRDFKARQRFLTQFQLDGGTRERAIELWDEAEAGTDEIVDTLLAEGLENLDDLSDAAMWDAINDWRDVRKAMDDAP